MENMGKELKFTHKRKDYTQDSTANTVLNEFIEIVNKLPTEEQIILLDMAKSLKQSHDKK